MECNSFDVKLPLQEIRVKRAWFEIQPGGDHLGLSIPNAMHAIPLEFQHYEYMCRTKEKNQEILG